MRLECFLFLCLLPGAADAADVTRHFATASGLHFFAGEKVEIAEVGADSVFAAGGTVDIAKAQAEHVFAAGEFLRLADSTIEDVFLAGRRIEIGGAVLDDIFAAGETVDVTPTATVGGDGLYAGRVLRLSGESRGDVIAAGGHVELAGSIAGNVTLLSPEIVLVPGLRVGGTLSYSSPEPLTIPEGVSIAGAIKKEEWPREANESDASSAVGVLIGAIATFAALALFAAVVLAAAPRVADLAAARLQSSPWLSLGIGLAATVGLPVAGVIVCLTVIGIPLGLFIIIASLVAFAASAVFGWTWLGNLVLARTKSLPADYGARVLCALGGLSVFVLVGLVPVAGPFAQFVTMVLGFGAFVLAVVAARSNSEVSTTP